MKQNKGKGIRHKDENLSDNEDDGRGYVTIDMDKKKQLIWSKVISKLFTFVYFKKPKFKFCNLSFFILIFLHF